jgi:hypothetical protein
MGQATPAAGSAPIFCQRAAGGRSYKVRTLPAAVEVVLLHGDACVGSARSIRGPLIVIR